MAIWGLHNGLLFVLRNTLNFKIGKIMDIQNKEAEYHKAIMRRKLLFNFLQLLSTTSDLYK